MISGHEYLNLIALLENEFKISIIDTFSEIIFKVESPSCSLSISFRNNLNSRSLIFSSALTIFSSYSFSS